VLKLKAPCTPSNAAQLLFGMLLRRRDDARSSTSKTNLLFSFSLSRTIATPEAPAFRPTDVRKARDQDEEHRERTGGPTSPPAWPLRPRHSNGVFPPLQNSRRTREEEEEEEAAFRRRFFSFKICEGRGVSFFCVGNSDLSGLFHARGTCLGSLGLPRKEKKRWRRSRTLSPKFFYLLLPSSVFFFLFKKREREEKKNSFSSLPLPTLSFSLSLSPDSIN
jgi:hypothetical protein